MFYVYIIYSKSLDKYYIGHSNDLKRRLIEHNNNTTRFTSSGSPWELKYSKSFDSRGEAMSYENSLKRKKSRKYLEWIISQSG